MSVSFTLPIPQRGEEILTPEALGFLAELVRQFNGRRKALLARRLARQTEIDAGARPDFLRSTRWIREASWRVAPAPADLVDRRVEITGPVERKMVINALNSGARVFMADFEDSNSPTWSNNVMGQVNLRDAVRGEITYTSPEGKTYQLQPPTAVLFVRPRGWHLEEAHAIVDKDPVPGSLFDFALFFFHNAKALREKGSGPYFYLPKMESHLEARLWNDVFVFAQDYCGIPRGSIRATVLIETIHAAFEMDEILYELRDHSAGLNCGRWDYIFSFTKVFRNYPSFILPDRAAVTMETPFLKAYVDLLIRTCHRRGAHAMGGMAAQIPIKNDPQANQAALARVREDKLREVRAGHDGTWVAHPGLVPVAAAVFDEYMKSPNQLHITREDAEVRGANLLEVPHGSVTEKGLERNVDVAIQYIESWLRGNGCVPIYNLMEDAATAEISRVQVWQWRHHGVKLSDGRAVTAELIGLTIARQLEKIKQLVGATRYEQGRFVEAARLFEGLALKEPCSDFLTLEAYRCL